MLFQFPMMLQGMLAATLQWRQLHHLCAPKLVLGFLISILRFFRFSWDKMYIIVFATFNFKSDRIKDNNNKNNNKNNSNNITITITQQQQ